jgi:hypothetical protein
MEVFCAYVSISCALTDSAVYTWLFSLYRPWTIYSYKMFDINIIFLYKKVNIFCSEQYIWKMKNEMKKKNVKLN